MGFEWIAIIIVIVILVSTVAGFMILERQKKSGFCPSAGPSFAYKTYPPMHLTACNWRGWDPAALAELKGLDDLGVYNSNARANRSLNEALDGAQSLTHYGKCRR